jgi:antirestriction protein ArdC
VLKRDKGASFSAASHAQRAADFLHDEREGAADEAGEAHTLAKRPR